MIKHGIMNESAQLVVKSAAHRWSLKLSYSLFQVH